MIGDELIMMLVPLSIFGPMLYFVAYCHGYNARHYRDLPKETVKKGLRGSRRRKKC